MRNTIRLKMTYDEVRVMVFALNELRNSLIAENRYTDAVDDILLKLLGSQSFTCRTQMGVRLFY